MDREVVSTADAPAAIGPYSQAIKVGNLIFCSGQIPLDPKSGEMVGAGDVEAEARQVMKNISAVLAEVGASFANIVKATIFLADLGDFAKVNAIYGSHFEGLSPPARSTIQVAALPKGARVEIEVIASL